MKKKSWKKFIWLLCLVMTVVFVSLSTEVIQAQTPVEDKVGVLITGWGMPSGYNHNYAWTSSDYPRIGDKTEVEGYPCKIGHVGEFPYQSHIGMIPFGITHLVEGLEIYFDYTGIYTWNWGDSSLKSASPEHYPDVTMAEIPTGVPIVPLGEVISHTGDLSYLPDPRDGSDPLSGWYRVGDWDNPFPNGVGDMVEGGPPFYTRLFNILGQPSDPQDRLQRNPYDIEQEEYFDMLMDAAFGDRIDLRYGWYTAIKDDNGTSYSKMMDDVAEEFATEGFTKLLLARETTDFNNYALEFMTGNYNKERLCELGVLDDTEIHMSRQIGRTPEYNTMVIRNITPNIEAHPEGSTIAIIYTTRGLTWGKMETSGNFGSPHPWSKEVYHENAYLNYLSLKKALKKEFGLRYNLVFTKGGIDSDNRTDNFYTYALGNDIDLQGYGGETVFSNIRDEIQRAKDDGIDKMIVVPGHWNSDNLDTILRMKEINSLPVLPTADIQAGLFDMTHCEPLGMWDAENEEWTGLDPVECTDPDAVTEITVAESFSHFAAEFGTSYYVVVRGNLEKFGLYPFGEEPAIAISQSVTKLLGGTVSVDNATSPVDGASITIPADPYPTFPEDFTWEDGFVNTARPIDDPDNTNDSMWEDTVIRIGQRSTPPAMTNAQAVGPAVYFGPYRNFFNRDVTITIPYDNEVAQYQVVKPYIYNHVTEAWDELESESYGNGLLTFKTQVLGLFRAGTDGTLLPDTISGMVSGDIQEGVTVNIYTLSCGIPQPHSTVITDTHGYYSTGALPDGRYLVEPNGAGYSFAPAGSWVDIPQAEIQSYDFTAIILTFCVSGEIQSCLCSDNTTAEQTCNDSGTGWETCECDNKYSYWNDIDTNLTWQDPQKDAYKIGDEAPGQPDAVRYCEELVLGGYDDWRLPDIDELRTLIRGHDGTITGGGCSLTEGTEKEAMFDPQCFAAAQYEGPGDGGCYWASELTGTCDKEDIADEFNKPLEFVSSTIATDDQFWAACILFDRGSVSYNHIYSYADVRCVRDGPTAEKKCSDDPSSSCAPGETQTCTTTDSTPGVQVCADDGSCWGPCEDSSFTRSPPIYDVSETCDQVNLTIRVPGEIPDMAVMMGFLFQSETFTIPPQRPPDGGTDYNQVFNPVISFGTPLQMTIPASSYYRDRCIPNGDYRIWVTLLQSDRMPPWPQSGDYWIGPDDPPLTLQTGTQQIIEKEITLVPW